MELLTNATLCVTGMFLVFTGMIMKTKNLMSSILFKVIPFLLGLLCLFCLAWRIVS